MIAVLTLSIVGCTETETEEIVLPPTRYGNGGGLAEYMTFDVADFYANAEVVARVKVGNWRWEDRVEEYTYFEAQALECYKGSLPEKFTLMQPATSDLTLHTEIFTYGNEKILFLSKAAPGRSPYQDTYGCGDISAMDVSYDNGGDRYVLVSHPFVAGSIPRTTPAKDLPAAEVKENLIKSDPILEVRIKGAQVLSEEDIKLFFASLEQEQNIAPPPERETGILPLTRFTRKGGSYWWDEEDSLESIYAEADVVARLTVGDWLGEDAELEATYYEATVIETFKGDIPKNFILKQNGYTQEGAILLFTYGNEVLLFLKADEDPKYKNTYTEIKNSTVVDIAYDDAGNDYYLARFDKFGATFPCRTLDDYEESYDIYNNLLEQDLMIGVLRDIWRGTFERNRPYTFPANALNEWFAEQKNG